MHGSFRSVLGDVLWFTLSRECGSTGVRGGRWPPSWDAGCFPSAFIPGTHVDLLSGPCASQGTAQASAHTFLRSLLCEPGESHQVKVICCLKNTHQQKLTDTKPEWWCPPEAGGQCTPGHSATSLWPRPSPEHRGQRHWGCVASMREGVVQPTGLSGPGLSPGRYRDRHNLFCGLRPDKDGLCYLGRCSLTQPWIHLSDPSLLGRTPGREQQH